MNICGVLVHADRSQRDAVKRALSGLPGVEVHHETEDGRFIVTVEDTPEAEAGGTLLEIHRISGVISVALAYQIDDPDAVANTCVA